MAVHALAALAALLVLAQAQALAKTHRDPHQRAAFMKQHPCPSTGKSRGSCPGYVIDHRHALKHGGKDEPSNMQWQTIAEGKAKDKVE